jgi:small-conductance mechanosensitive channel
MQSYREDYLNPVFEVLNYNLFSLGNARISPLIILYFVLLTAVLLYVSRRIGRLLVDQLAKRTKLDIGAQQAIGTVTRYIILFVGFLIIIQTVGIDLTTLNVLAGAIGIGIGLGLQNIANNFISGLIILFERPIKVGDRVEVGGLHGRVVTIGARSTAIRTNDNITVIVPNSKFISENVVNWSFGDEKIRFKVPVGVGYDSDVDLVERLLLEAANENEDVLKEPPPSVRFIEFGDHALNFELRAWSHARLHRPGLFKSNLNFAIIRKFRDHGIEIPNQQHDIHLRTGRLKGSETWEIDNPAFPWAVKKPD